MVLLEEAKADGFDRTMVAVESLAHRRRKEEKEEEEDGTERMEVFIIFRVSHALFGVTVLLKIFVDFIHLPLLMVTRINRESGLADLQPSHPKSSSGRRILRLVVARSIDLRVWNFSPTLNEHVLSPTQGQGKEREKKKKKKKADTRTITPNCHV